GLQLIVKRLERLSGADFPIPAPVRRVPLHRTEAFIVVLSEDFPDDDDESFSSVKWNPADWRWDWEICATEPFKP
ncbi:hypothetical protein QCD79_32025, partial [Pseudomonas quasicaspiana]|nr:hypothetical protein [Pseudomonas quasicaspiana]